MKRTILLLSLIFASYGFSQEDRKVERLWVSGNIGFFKYAEVGAHVQLFKQFLIGSYFQNFVRNVGPGVPENPNALFYTPHSYKQDKVTSGSVLIGFASPTPHSTMLSFLVGPSLNKCTTHSDFETSSSSNGNYIVGVSSTVEERWKVGLNYKATVSFIIRNRVCINLGLAGNYNGIDNYNQFILGIGAGEFGCFQRPSRR